MVCPRAALAVRVSLCALIWLAGNVTVQASSVSAALPGFIGNPNGRPDAFIVTRSLSDLPKDIVRQQVLKEVLTEDFVFYYQESESYLGLKGALKRIAFEHELTLFDELLSYFLRTPAELALWKSHDGKLEDYMLILERNALTDLLSAAAKVAASDSQLSKHSEKTENGLGMTIYRFRYSASKDLYFTGMKNRLVVFSRPDMPLPTEERLKAWGFGDTSGYSGKHSLHLTVSYLSFGYQKLFPAIDTIRFRFSEKQGWSTEGLFHPAMSGNLGDSNELWRAVPKNPSICAALPVDSGRLGELLAGIFKGRESEMKNLLSGIQAPVGVCWYAESTLYTPLFLAKVNRTMSKDALRNVFQRSVGNLEAGILSETERTEFERQKDQRAAGEQVQNPIKATKFEVPFPVIESKKKDGTVWSREVSSRYGLHESKKSTNARNMRSDRYFNVRMAQWKGYLAFSPDDRLVDNAISVIDKRYPALSDVLSGGASSGLVIFPPKLADLLRQSALDSLPAGQESVFRESASRCLFPAFDRMKKLSGMTVSWPRLDPGGQARWEELKWQVLSSN